jgi:hypothetical protein
MEQGYSMRDVHLLDRYHQLVGVHTLAIANGAQVVRIELAGVDEDVIGELDARLARAKGWMVERRDGAVIMQKGIKGVRAPL